MPVVTDDESQRRTFSRRCRAFFLVCRSFFPHSPLTQVRRRRKAEAKGKNTEERIDQRCLKAFFFSRLSRRFFLPLLNRTATNIERETTGMNDASSLTTE